MRKSCKVNTQMWSQGLGMAFLLGAALLSAASFQAALAQTAPSLGSAQSFAVLGGSTVTNTGATIITGDLGVSPGTAITGFPPGTVTGGTFSNVPPATSAHGDLITAYNAAAAATCPGANNLTGKDLGTLAAPLMPGVYCLNSSAQLTGKLSLNAGGNANAVFIFQIGSTLTTATNSSVVMTNGGQDTNVFWQIGSSATLGTGTGFTGNILALTSITLTTGASVSGRALAITGAVTMDTNNVSAKCSSVPCQPLPFPRVRSVAQLLIDHYECYQAKPEERVQPHEVVLEDQFGKRTVTLKRPRLICTPVVKNEDPDNAVKVFPDDLRNPIDHLVCYRIHERGGKDIKERDDNSEESDYGDNIEEESHGKGNEPRGVLMENQFGKMPFTVKKPRLLCVPSLKTLQGDQHDRD